MTRIRRPDFDFSFDSEACRTCRSACCRGEPGYIWVSQGELKPMADFLNITVIDLIKDKLVRAANRYSIREHLAGGEHCCIFLDPEKGCTIYPVRPHQCRTYPFWDRFRTCPDQVMEACPGVDL
ncbi:MAG: YkgJ family cysteine cluster protein [Pseudomonadota bacterium]